MADGQRQPYSDEVSLRELYLIFRGGLPLIIGVALVCAAAAFVYLSFQPTKYEATATVNVIPPFVGTDSLSGLELSVTAGIDEQSYEEIAFSTEMLSSVGAPLGLSAVEVEARVSLEARDAPSQARGHLVVDHRVTMAGDDGLQVAADLANRWAEGTVAQVAEALSSHLSGAVETVMAEIDVRRAAYQEASDAWAEFLATDQRVALQERLAQMAVDPATDSDEVAALQARLGELERRAATLEREVATTSLVYFRVAPTGPALELQRDLVAGSVFVAIPASTPVEAEGTGRLVVTIAVALVAGLLATLVVFFRAAVRER